MTLDYVSISVGTINPYWLGQYQQTFAWTLLHIELLLTIVYFKNHLL